MVRTSTARHLDDLAQAEGTPGQKFGGSEPPAPPVRPTIPVGSNAWFATVMFLGAEAMFFAGLIGAFIVFRVGSASWPPPFQPRLPVGITGVNTAILVFSAVTMHLALRSVRLDGLARSIRMLAITAALGGTFLVIQGYEWVRLIHFGLTVSSSVYGGLFYTLIGFHAFHVAGALIWLVMVFLRARHGHFTKHKYTGLQICAMYWTFVVGLWPILYGLVYLY